jgi:hypothetical protein
VSLKVSGVEDLVGNALLRPVSWEFSIEDEVSVSSKTTLEGVILNIPYLAEYDNATADVTINLTTAIIRDIASLLYIPTSYVGLSLKNSTSGLVSADISITTLAISAKSSSDIADELLRIISSNNRRRATDSYFLDIVSKDEPVRYKITIVTM